MTKQTADAATGWVKTNALVLALLVFQVIQFVLSQGFQTRVNAQQIADIASKVNQVQSEAATKELLTTKIEAVQGEIHSMKDSLDQHMRETRK
jgi:Tfp pilus assembly protein PilO